MYLLWSLILSLFAINIILTYVVIKQRNNSIILKHKLDLKSYQLLSFEEKNNFLQQESDYQKLIADELKKIDLIDSPYYYIELIKNISSLLDVSHSYYFEYLPRDNKFKLKYSTGLNKQQYPHTVCNIHDNELGFLWSSEETHLIFEKLKNEKRFKFNFSVDEYNLNSGAIFTVVHPYSDEKIGIVGFYSEEENIFNELEINLINSYIHFLQQNRIHLDKNNTLDLLDKGVNFILNGLVILDATKVDYPIIYVNDCFLNITGYQKDDVLGKNYSSLFHQNSSEYGLENLTSAIARGKETNVIIKNYRQTGELYWSEVYLYPICKQKKLTNFIIIERDVTQEYNYQSSFDISSHQSRYFEEKLQEINEIQYDLNQDLTTNLSQCLSYACEILGMQIGVVMEVSEYKSLIIGQYFSFSDQLFFDNEYSLMHILSREICTIKDTIYNGYSTHFNSLTNDNFINNLSVTSYLATPIWINGSIYGTIHLFDIDNNVHYFREQKYLLEAIAHSIAKAIIAEEKELEKEYIRVALEESQERLKGVLFSLEDVIWSIHPQTLQLIYINTAATNLYECELSLFFQKRCFWLELVHPEDKERVKDYYSKILNIAIFDQDSNSHDIEYRIISCNGEEKYVRDRAYLVFDNYKKLIRIDGIITDITKKNLTQKALKKSERELQLIFELAPIGMMITNKKGVIQKTNNSLCQLLNYSSTELINQNEKILYHPDDVSKNYFFLESILKDTQQQYSQERRYISKNGTVIHTMVDITILRNARGEILQLIQQIVDISQIKNMQEQMLHDSMYDSLTGLANRFLLMDRLAQTLKRCDRNPHELCAILLIDIDNFKKVNDSMGHNIGDQLLSIIASKIISCVSEKDTVARVSGDEFVILLEELESPNQARKVAENIINICDTDYYLENHYVASSVSIGITLSSIGYENAEQMIRDADLTMHEAKTVGKNCYQLFKPIMHKELVQKLQLESYLRKALENNELELFYQPIINLKTSQVAGFEALIRWFHPELGFISPVKFIPLAEENGLIVSLGDWIFRTAAFQAKQWQDKYPQLNLSVAINVSSKQLLEHDFLGKIDRCVAQTGVNPLLLKLEITESVLMDNFQTAKYILDNIQTRHLKISLDDFGTGYSSLSYLHALPFNTLKIDRAFIESINREHERNAIVEAIVSLAHNLSLDVVAEGIELPIQEEILKEIGCDYGQGYYYAKPMSASLADSFIEQWNSR
ncbi:diguanylate cyclase/phosphodiesterase with PAS/PAC and GAF sensor(s) [Cyanobacterium stanieri PCC 7202]|uniref:Diguanylate cyclase/phosphodiesterase with PAS/PAC and GAF sensor(S) n=1 Tax=Cyanobacterium stanieri (strain ATCC 29140 / PCC 7202) TaxID=292563 RepID=K9YI58_CYASC|nr:diguanylate cyclase/phosphodiesterase with PAS/PAC and GAF sensor(s) [Cyanobacterium stanieri PCC 7202]